MPKKAILTSKWNFERDLMKNPSKKGFFMSPIQDYNSAEVFNLFYIVDQKFYDHSDPFPEAQAEALSPFDSTGQELYDHSDPLPNALVLVNPSYDPFLSEPVSDDTSELLIVSKPAHSQEESLQSFDNFICKICFQTFDREKSLRHHKRTHTLPSYNCTFCPQIFKYQNVFTRHIKEHLHERTTYFHKP